MLFATFPAYPCLSIFEFSYKSDFSNFWFTWIIWGYTWCFFWATARIGNNLYFQNHSILPDFGFFPQVLVQYLHHQSSYHWRHHGTWITVGKILGYVSSLVPGWIQRGPDWGSKLSILQTKLRREVWRKELVLGFSWSLLLESFESTETWQSNDFSI